MNIGRANPATHRFTQYQVKSQGDHITVQDPHSPNQLEGSISVSPEQIEVFTRGSQYKIELGPEGVAVSNPASSRGAYEMVLPTPLQPEQYRSTGLSVAFALMGLPLPPQLLQEQAAGQQSPLNFDVSVANPNSPGLANFQVRQQGDELTVGDPRDRMFRAGMDLSKPDQIMLFADQRQYRIQMGPEGVQVDNPKNDGMRSGMYDLVLTTPLRPEEYRRTGLSVAFSLLGLPLPPHLLS